MYFKSFPKLQYDFSIGSEPAQKKYVVDIFRNVKVSSQFLNNTSAYESYIIKDGDTVEIISKKYYGTPYYHWLIMLVNNILDPINDMPRTQYYLEQYISAKYGSDNVYATHHYEDSSGTWINPINIPSKGGYCTYDPNLSDWVLVNVNSLRQISNYDYEFSVNESKRSISLVRPLYLSGVVSEFDKMIRQ